MREKEKICIKTYSFIILGVGFLYSNQSLKSNLNLGLNL